MRELQAQILLMLTHIMEKLGESYVTALILVRLLHEFLLQVKE